MTKKIKNILIIGAGPLPNDTIGIREAAGLRTHQFTKSTESNTHKITLVCIHNNANFTEQEDQDRIDTRKNHTYKNTTIIRLHRHDKHLTKKIKDLITKQDNIDIIIGVNTFPAFIASQICPKNIPFWADLNGWIMAESQARGFSEKTNIHFANAWKQERQILDKADRISTVSTAQKFCTIGEMASCGYIKQENFHTEIVHSIPNTTELFEVDKTDATKLFKGIKIPEDSIVISHIGGYNNWVDTSTLFSAIDNAMSICPNLYFISTGGAIKDVSNTVFSNFLDKIDTSKHKNRYIFLGWIDTKDMCKVYTESDIGINVDFNCIETQTGARNRLNEMLKFQLPIISTNESEIAKDIEKYKAGECTESGNTKELTRMIIKMAIMTKESTSEIQKYKKNCQFLHSKIYNIQNTMTPLLQFIENPSIRNKTNNKQDTVFTFLQNALWYLQKNGIKQTFNKFIQRFF